MSGWAEGPGGGMLAAAIGDAFARAARLDAALAWERRKDQLDVVLTEAEWARLRLELREACAAHPKTDPLYLWARDCPHDVPLDDYDWTDELHERDEDGELFCLAEVVGHECSCGDGFCASVSRSIDAHTELWSNVSAPLTFDVEEVEL